MCWIIVVETMTLITCSIRSNAKGLKKQLKKLSILLIQIQVYIPTRDFKIWISNLQHIKWTQARNFKINNLKIKPLQINNQNDHPSRCNLNVPLLVHLSLTNKMLKEFNGEDLIACFGVWTFPWSWSWLNFADRSFFCIRMLSYLF